MFVSNAGDCTTPFPCALGTIPVGESRTIMSTYFVPATYTLPDPIVNTVVVSADQAEPQPGEPFGFRIHSISTRKPTCRC